MKRFWPAGLTWRHYLFFAWQLVVIGWSLFNGQVSHHALLRSRATLALLEQREQQLKPLMAESEQLMQQIEQLLGEKYVAGTPAWQESNRLYDQKFVLSARENDIMERYLAATRSIDADSWSEVQTALNKWSPLTFLILIGGQVLTLYLYLSGLRWVKLTSQPKPAAFPSCP